MHTYLHVSYSLCLLSQCRFSGVVRPCRAAKDQPSATATAAAASGTAICTAASTTLAAAAAAAVNTRTVTPPQAMPVAAAGTHCRCCDGCRCTGAWSLACTVGDSNAATWRVVCRRTAHGHRCVSLCIVCLFCCCTSLACFYFVVYCDGTAVLWAGTAVLALDGPHVVRC